MDETRAETPGPEAQARPDGNLTPAQLKAAAKVVHAHRAQVDRELRRVEPPPEHELVERPAG